MSYTHDELVLLVEAALFSAGKPLSRKVLCNELLAPYQVSFTELDKIIKKLQEDYSERAIQLVKVSSGYRFQTVTKFKDDLARLVKEKTPRFSKAFMETLALIAYRQPISRGEIEQIRGVAVSSYIIKTLIEQQWIKIVGYKEVPGKPALYATTKLFLDYFSLSSIEQLPEIIPNVISSTDDDITQLTESEA
jgi:segregation and condensation protein B